MLEISESSDVTVHSISEIEKYAAWVLGMVVAVTVFFQAHVSFPGGVLNLNLADPFAMLTLAGLTLHVLYTGESPVWRIKKFNLALGAISLLLLLGFLHGWVDIGVTQWALVGRLLGWFVLLGYLSAGYLIVSNVGSHGLRRFSETMIATVAVVVMMQIIVRILYCWDINLGTKLPVYLEGYAGNRNAFAFQLLVGMALLLGYSQVYARNRTSLPNSARPWVFSVLLGTLLTGLFWTSSRTGIVTGMAIILVAGISRLANRRMIAWSLIFAVLLWCGVWLALQRELVEGLFSGNIVIGGNVPLQVAFSPDSSIQEHRLTLVHGLELWLQSPVLGVGLGVFYAMSPMWLGHPQVIHSTPLWILAEFGLVGGAVFGWAFVLLARYALRFQRSQPSRRILLFLLSAFGIFGLAHEIFFQRIFWLVLGAVLAQPCPSRDQT